MTDVGTPGGKTAFFTSVAAVVLAAGVLVGWSFNIEILRSLIPGVVAMNPATAILFIFAGTSLALSLRSPSSSDKKSQMLAWIARLCALLVALIGLVKFTGYIFGADIPFDRMLFAAQMSEGGHLLPNRIAPNSALNFLLLGTALLFVDLNKKFLRFCLELFAGVVFFGALIAVLGHAYHIRTFYDFGKFSPMSLYTGTLFLMMSVAFFLAHTDRGLLAIFVGKSAGGEMGRLLLPAAIVIPSGLGWLTLQGQAIGFYPLESGEALFVVGNIVVFTGVICWSARSLFQADIERERSEKALQWQTALLEAQLNSSIDGILVVDQQNKKILQNQRMADLFKIPAQIAEDKNDESQLQWVASVVANPMPFVEKVLHLNANPEERSQDEIDLKDGTTLERYSSRVVGKDGASYGRIWTFRDITKRREAEREIRLNEQRYRSLVEATAAIVWDTPASGEFVAEQHDWTDFTGQSFEELRGWGWLNAIHPDDRAKTTRVWAEAVASGGVYEIEHRLMARDGTYHDMMVRAVPILNQNGDIVQWMGVHTDITMRKRLETQLFQSQKLETVGKLAGGVAHEFNSILTAILGQSELLLGDLPPGSPLVKSAAEISKAAGRAATLTRQLLAYGRKQVLQPEILDLGVVLSEMESTLRHLMGQEVDVRICPAVGTKTVRVDAGQIEQVIVNMAINARDVMPHGGKLTLETANVSFDADTVGRYPELRPGDYVMLAIADTGGGMGEDVQARLFEPFFSTKEVGRGAGLGLSTCYGIIKQSGGHIGVYSEQSRGTTFKIYLPQVDPLPALPRQQLNSGGMRRGTETILLVEDDPALREMAAELLARLGYHILTAANGVEALNLNQLQDIGHLDLLFTDVIMPHMSGKELSERVRAFSPDTKVLFSSAYTENAIVHQGVLDPGMMLLQKPFAPSALANKVREILDQAPLLSV
jgi:two-component system, cell cycle sensor histidine kinase and response regulator CckA